MMLKAISDRLAYRIGPELTKVFAFKAGAKRYTMRDMELGKSCGVCHNGKDAFTSVSLTAADGVAPADLRGQVDLDVADVADIGLRVDRDPAAVASGLPLKVEP